MLIEPLRIVREFVRVPAALAEIADIADKVL
jgi:hypothetical protein